jgi:hypothetical protein
LRELAAFNTGLCVITTRTPIADIADHERTSALRRDLEHLSNDAGASLLRALGVKGDELELLNASKEFSGHCLALTLLGSYLTDAYDGDIRRRSEASGQLAHDIRQGAHAQKVMESYEAWFGEGAELSVLRILGLFDRPVDEKVLGVLLKPPAIPGLTQSLTDLSPTKWRMILKAIPTITARIGAGGRITREALHKMPPAAALARTRRPPPKSGPKKISIAKLPVTGSELFGREEDIAFLDDAWVNKDVNVVTIVAWAGVGKSTLVNHWLRRMAAEQYCSAQMVFWLVFLQARY